jgi:hypothetical protein
MAFGVVLYIDRLVFYGRRASGPLMRELLVKEANMIPVQIFEKQNEETWPNPYTLNIIDLYFRRIK